MQNIVEMQSTLQNLSDAQLHEQLRTPSEMAPSYLVLTEMQRRNAMREAYEGETAKFTSQQPTVAENMLNNASAEGGGSAPVSQGAPTAGLSALAPSSGPPAFADGGLVDGLPGGGYADTFARMRSEFGDRASGFDTLRERLAELESSSAEREDNAVWLALVRAGLGMAASDSPYIGQAIGEGGVAGFDSYAQSLQDSREDEYQRLALEGDITAGEEARALADIQAAQAGAAAQTGAEQADRSFGLAADEFNFTKDEANRLQQNVDREYKLLMDRFGFDKEEARAAAEQRGIDNALNERRVAVEEAREGKPPALAQVFDHFLELPPEDRDAIMAFQGSGTSSKTIAEAQRMWNSTRKAVDKELEEDFAYQELLASEDPAQQREAESMRWSRYRERYVDDAPSYALLVDMFGQATAERAAQLEQNRGLNIVGDPTMPPPEGATMLPLVDPGAAVGPDAAVEPGAGGSGFVEDLQNRTTVPREPSLWDQLMGMDIEEGPGFLEGEPGYRPIVRGLQQLGGAR